MQQPAPFTVAGLNQDREELVRMIEKHNAALAWVDARIVEARAWEDAVGRLPPKLEDVSPDDVSALLRVHAGFAGSSGVRAIAKAYLESLAIYTWTIVLQDKQNKDIDVHVWFTSEDDPVTFHMRSGEWSVTSQCLPAENGQLIVYRYPNVTGPGGSVASLSTLLFYNNVAYRVTRAGGDHAYHFYRAHITYELACARIYNVGQSSIMELARQVN